MASDEDSNHNKNSSHSRGWPEDDNPFVAFRRFADEQISSMLQSVMGLPSMASPPSSSHWDIFENDRKYHKDAHFRQRQTDGKDGEYPSPDSDNHGGGAQGDSENNTLSRSRWSSSSDIDDHHRRANRPARHPYDLSDVDLFFDSFFDKFWFDDHFSSRFFHPYHRPMFSNMIGEDSSTWPITYLLFNPYSPLHLERQAHYNSHRDRGVFSSIMSSLTPSSSERDPAEPQWREAFEDLLRLENGKPMLDRTPAESSVQESGKEWLQNLAKRGSLGDKWKFVSSSDDRPWSGIAFEGSGLEKKDDRRSLPEGERAGSDKKAGFSWNGKDPESVTELDMYERFLEDIAAREREVFTDRESPLLRFLLEEKQRLSEGGVPSSQKESQGEDTESWLELVSGGQRNSVPDTVPEKEQQPSQPTAVEASSPEKSATAQEPYVISTKIITERIRLSDGSIQTKTINTKRFTDGREESNESVEVVNPPQHNQLPAQEGSSSSQSKSGWFWKGD